MSEVTSKSRGKQVAFGAALVTAALVASAIVSRLSGWNTSSELEAGSHRRNSEGFSGLIYVAQPMNWDQANHWCRSHGGQLATADSPEKAEKIRARAPGKHVWIGYRSTSPNPSLKNSYRWQSGAPWNGWTNWAPNEPNNVPQWPQEFCTEQLPDKRWNNLKCNDGRWLRPFVCDKSPYFQSYALHGVNGAGLNYDQANDKCREWYGTGLATMSDPDNMRYVVQQGEVPRAWIGVRLQPGLPFHVAHFKHMNGRPTPPLRWAPNEPNNFGTGEQCGEIHNNGLLNDLPCHAKLRNFICDQFMGGDVWSYSSFELMSERGPIKGWRVPAKVIDYRGRRRYSLFFQIRINGLNPHWTNFLHVGQNGHIRNPAIWQFPYQYRRLHFRQRGKIGAAVHWNLGCDPAECHTPPLGRWFQVQVLIEPNKFSVKYDGHFRCSAAFVVEAYPGELPVFVSNAWNIPAPVSYRSLGFNIF